MRAVRRSAAGGQGTTGAVREHRILSGCPGRTSGSWRRATRNGPRHVHHDDHTFGPDRPARWVPSRTTRKYGRSAPALRPPASRPDAARPPGARHDRAEGPAPFPGPGANSLSTRQRRLGNHAVPAAQMLDRRRSARRPEGTGHARAGAGRRARSVLSAAGAPAHGGKGEGGGRGPKRQAPNRRRSGQNRGHGRGGARGRNRSVAGADFTLNEAVARAPFREAGGEVLGGRGPARPAA